MSTRRKTQSNHRAINKLRTMSGSSRAESERDSGFSDTSSEPNSTRGTTDSEDLTHCAPQQGATLGSGSVISQLAVVGGSSYPNMSPMIIMNNVLLKQSSDPPKPLKPWGFRPAVEGVLPVVPPAQVVFIQPMLSHPAPPPHKDPHSSRHRRPKKYLPVLKSYPRIAPHPGDSSSSSLGSTGTASSLSASSTSSSSSASSRSKRGTKMTSGHWEHSHRGKRHHQKKKSQSGGGASPSGSTAIAPVSPSALSQKPLSSVESERLAPSVTVPPSSEPRESPPVAPTTLQTRTSPVATTTLQTRTSPVATTTLQTRTTPVATTTLQTRTTPVATTTLQTQTTLVAPTTLQTQTSLTSCDPKPTGPGADPDPETKRMRFCNTYNILSESGLLDITLKTKELQRQNRHTQGELDRLKEHTELFIQALLSGDPGVVLRLQTRLQEEEEEEEEEEDPERGGDTGECDAA
ncbi:CLOCK-interacting pacemaker [Gadus morhua]|uniref:CLOCK-interacting pacemaker n=1 Tax=Gadus morhua TaxID=8049 RepID=UPI0011B5825C|nr:CLOCK-interacting pacemaker-like [Gadus morhua]XP_030200536.1 CLOCK-interacting pacemaker-like [Gadus morhua]